MVYRVIDWVIECISDVYEFLWKLSDRRAEKKIARIARVDAHSAVMVRARIKWIRIVLNIVYHILVILITGWSAVFLFIYGNSVFFGIMNAFLPASICLASVVSLFFNKSSNISLLEATDVVKQKSPYALYLRAFKSDLSRRNFNEEDLVQKLLQQKVVTYAVGLPEEVDAFPGAKRVYINDNTWQEEVRLMINGATYVFLRVCNTDPCLWELEQALSHSNNLYIIIENAKEYETVREKFSNLPQNISLHNDMYVIYKRLHDGTWEQQWIEEPDSDPEYDDFFKENYIAGLLESYPVPEESRDYVYEKSIEGLLSNTMVGWEQKYTTPIATRTLDLIEAYIDKINDDEFDSERTFIQAQQYLNMFKRFSPLEEYLIQRWNELFDRVENLSPYYT